MIKKVNKYNILKKKKKLYNYFLMNNQYLIRKKIKKTLQIMVVHKENVSS